MNPFNKLKPKYAGAILCVLIGSSILAGIYGFSVALIVIGIGFAFTDSDSDI